jgi:hypothetical protein
MSSADHAAASRILTGRGPGTPCTRAHTVVTGASSGIGRATALRLAAAGQQVYAGVRTDADGADLAGPRPVGT